MFRNMSFKFGTFSTINSSSNTKMKSFYSSLVEEKGGLLMDSSNASAGKTIYFVVLDDDVENNHLNDNVDSHNQQTNNSNGSSSGINSPIIISYHWIAACVTANGLVPVQRYLVAPSGRPQFIYEMKTVSKNSIDPPLSIPSDSTKQPPENSLLDIYLQILVQKQSNALDRSTNDSLEGIEGIRGCVFSLSGFPKRRTNNDTLMPDKGELELGIRLAGGRVGDGCMVQGITSYLICSRRQGDKFDAATRWGTDKVLNPFLTTPYPRLSYLYVPRYPKIKIVTWTWLFRCLQHWTCMDPETEEHVVLAADTTAHANDHNTNSPISTNHDIAQREEHVMETDPPAPELIGPLSQFAMDFYDSPATQPPPKDSSRMVNSIHSDTKSESINIAKSDFVQSTSTTSRCFVLGGGNDLEACEQRAKTILEGLGANVIWPLETRFDVAGTTSGNCVVTHVILWGPLKRTEKYLCAVAAGMWLLHPDYIDVCELAGCFVPEEPFEWQTRDNTNALAHAASYRRRKCADGEALVFSDQRYMIVGSTTPPADTLCRIIERGGGIADIINTMNELTAVQNTDNRVVVQRTLTAIIKAGVTTSTATASSNSSSSASSALAASAASASSSSSSSSTLIPMLPPSFVLDVVCAVDNDLFKEIKRCCTVSWDGSMEVTGDSINRQSIDTAGSKRMSTNKTKQKGKRCKS